mgnify:CR=1 FL=1
MRHRHRLTSLFVYLVHVVCDKEVDLVASNRPPCVLVYLGDGADGPAEAFPLAKTDEDADYDSWLLLEPEPQPEPQPEPEPMATEE